MPDVMDEDLAGYGQPAPPPAVSPSLGNQDITKGPVMSELPAPYQPPQQSGNWDSSQYISEAFKRLPPDVALKAMEGAIQLEGQLGYAADIKAGVPEMSALQKWAPKMYHRNPAVAARLAQPAFQPSTRQVGGQTLIQTSPNRYQIAPGGQPTGPIEAQEVMGPGGEALPGLTAIRGRGGSVHVIPQKKEGPNPTQLGVLIKHQLDDIGLQLRDVGAEGGIKENSSEHKALLADQRKYRNELKKLTDQVLAPAGGKRAKPKPGQVVDNHRYKGGDPNEQESWEALE